jgi:hypothetical protein
MKDQKTAPAGKEKGSPRATSDGGLGQGRETAGGTAGEIDHIGAPGKGMGGTDDTGGAIKPPEPGNVEDERSNPTPPEGLDLPVNSGP